MPAPFERKDVWDVKWAEDDPNSIAVMEKTRLYVPPLTWQDRSLTAAHVCMRLSHPPCITYPWH